MSEKKITHCPLCGGKLEIDDRGIQPDYECTECGTKMLMEVWGSKPDFWHIT